MKLSFWGTCHANSSKAVSLYYALCKLLPMKNYKITHCCFSHRSLSCTTSDQRAIVLNTKCWSNFLKRKHWWAWNNFLLETKTFFCLNIWMQYKTFWKWNIFVHFNSTKSSADKIVVFFKIQSLRGFLVRFWGYWLIFAGEAIFPDAFVLIRSSRLWQVF